MTVRCLPLCLLPLASRNCEDGIVGSEDIGMFKSMLDGSVIQYKQAVALSVTVMILVHVLLQYSQSDVNVTEAALCITLSLTFDILPVASSSFNLLSLLTDVPQRSFATRILQLIERFIAYDRFQSGRPLENDVYYNQHANVLASMSDDHITFNE
ncbi:hypothetical protein Tco_1108115 [Tanacetum coccineum]